MLSRQPRSAKTVKLHFDRKSALTSGTTAKAAPHLVKIVEQGAWSVKGRRKSQEDAFGKTFTFFSVIYMYISFLFAWSLISLTDIEIVTKSAA